MNQRKKEPKEEPKAVLDPVLVSQWEVELERFVYDPELAKELAPVFVRLLSVEGFDKVIELLETKEKQIEAISSGSNQQSNPDQKQEPQEVKAQILNPVLSACKIFSPLVHHSRFSILLSFFILPKLDAW